MKKCLQITLIFTFSFLLRSLALWQTHYVNGWDGYFYLIQIKAWLEEGAMHSQDASIIYPLLIAIQFFTSDYVTSYKLISAILAASFSVSLYAVALSWSKDKWIAFFVGACTVFSPQLTYFAAQYPKNLLGLVFFNCTLLALSKLQFNAPKKQQILPFMLLGSVLILNYFGHRMTAVLSILIVGMHIVFARLSWKWLVGLMTLGLGSIVVLYSLFSGVLNPSDLGRFSHTFTTEIHFSPYSFYQTFSENDLLSYAWIAEIIVAVLAFVIAWGLVFKSKNWTLLSLLLLLLFLLFPFFKWSLTGMSYRFYLVFVLLCPLLFSFVPKRIFTRRIAIMASIVLLACSAYSYRSYDVKKHDPPYDLFAEITTNTQDYFSKNLQLPKPELVIAHNSLAEYYTFTTWTDAMPWLPEYEIDSTKLWRIATELRPALFRSYFETPKGENYGTKLSARYYLVREDKWQLMLRDLEGEGDASTLEYLQTWKNPSRVRPAFLLKK